MLLEMSRNEVGWANSINYKRIGRTRSKIGLSLMEVYDKNHQSMNIRNKEVFSSNEQNICCIDTIFDKHVFVEYRIIITRLHIYIRYKCMF